MKSCMCHKTKNHRLCAVFALACAAMSVFRAGAKASEYDIAAYVWPAYQPEPRWAELGIFAAGKGEWAEGSYLEPDTVNGFGYLEAVRRVFGTDRR